MDISKLINELKAAKVSSFQACLKSIRESQCKDNSLDLLIESLTKDVQNYCKSLEEIEEWHEDQQEKVLCQTLSRLCNLNISSVKNQHFEVTQ